MFFLTVPCRLLFRRDSAGNQHMNNENKKETMRFNKNNVASISESDDYYVMTVTFGTYVDYYRIDKDDIYFEQIPAFSEELLCTAQSIKCRDKNISHNEEVGSCES